MGLLYSGSRIVAFPYWLLNFIHPISKVLPFLFITAYKLFRQQVIIRN